MQSTLAARIFGDKEDPRVRLQVLYGGALPPSGQPPESAVTWARDVLWRSGNTTADVLTKVGDLREADARLTLKAATFLARHVHTPTPIPASTTALLKRTLVKAIVAVLALVALIALLAAADKGSPLAIVCAWAAGVLLVGKEILSAFARDRGLDPVKARLEDLAAICSLFGTVAAVPAVFAAIG
ncbi:hypothetical protein [Curtobacterium sp. MCBA15_007]|uniref:hypothetical protein n=1 Tax=Curtobacterium sp. MCBA15_007 TaxID=1898735 RepID=UPI0011146904|nr:hypothetical protein [Curtobacterium sp. MCBA15_007]